MSPTTVYVLLETEQHKCYMCRMTVKAFASQGVTERDLNIIEVPFDSPTVDELSSKGFASFPVVVPGDDWSQAWGGFRPDQVKAHAAEMMQHASMVS